MEKERERERESIPIASYVLSDPVIITFQK